MIFNKLNFAMGKIFGVLSLVKGSHQVVKSDRRHAIADLFTML